MRRPPREKRVVVRIMERLQEVEGLVVRKRHGTVMGVAGDPDLYGCYLGRHFEFEVKRPNDPSSVPTKLQQERLREWRASGSVAGVVRSPAEALALLGIRVEAA